MAELTEFTKFSPIGDVSGRDECSVQLSDSTESTMAVGGLCGTGPKMVNGRSKSRKLGRSGNLGIEYGVDDLPAIHMCFLFGMQVCIVVYTFL